MKETDAKTTLFGAALHYNDELKKDVEAWIHDLVRKEVQYQMDSGSNFERHHINNFNIFRRLIREALKQDMETLRSNQY